MVVLFSSLRTGRFDGTEICADESLVIEYMVRKGLTSPDFAQVIGSTNTILNQNNTGPNENESVVDVTFSCLAGAIH